MVHLCGMFVYQVHKLVKKLLLSDDDDKDSFEKGCVLIRSNLDIDPEKCNYEEWAESYAQALWLEKFRNKNLVKMLTKLLGGDTKP